MDHQDFCTLEGSKASDNANVLGFFAFLFFNYMPHEAYEAKDRLT